MAQTTDQIYQELIAEKNLQGTLTALQPNIDSEQLLLAELTTPSKVAEWRTWLYIFSLGARKLQVLFDAFKVTMTSMIDESKVGSTRWLHKKAFEFQLGYTLTWNGKSFEYDNTGVSGAAVVASKIIKRAAIVETGGQVRVKVAKVVAGTITPLTLSEKNAFAEYMAQLCPAGTNLLVTSQVPDSFIYDIDVHFDPAVLDALGQSWSAPGTYPADAALRAYIANLPFNGRFSTTEFQDAIQRAPGVRRVVLNNVAGWYGSLGSMTITDTYIPDGGYLSIYYGVINYYPDVI